MGRMADPITPPYDFTRKRRAKSTSAPPRPPNAWILYRSDKMREMQRDRTLLPLNEAQSESSHANHQHPLDQQRNIDRGSASVLSSQQGDRRSNERRGEDNRNSNGLQAQVSRVVSQMWKEESAEVRERYAQLAAEHKARHRALYPDYKYQPRRRSRNSDASLLTDAHDPSHGPSFSLPDGIHTGWTQRAGMDRGMGHETSRPMYANARSVSDGNVAWQSNVSDHHLPSGLTWPDPSRQFDVGRNKGQPALAMSNAGPSMPHTHLSHSTMPEVGHAQSVFGSGGNNMQPSNPGLTFSHVTPELHSSHGQPHGFPYGAMSHSMTTPDTWRPNLPSESRSSMYASASSTPQLEKEEGQLLSLAQVQRHARQSNAGPPPPPSIRDQQGPREPSWLITQPSGLTTNPAQYEDRSPTGLVARRPSIVHPGQDSHGASGHAYAMSSASHTVGSLADQAQPNHAGPMLDPMHIHPDASLTHEDRRKWLQDRAMPRSCIVANQPPAMHGYGNQLGQGQASSRLGSSTTPMAANPHSSVYTQPISPGNITASAHSSIVPSQGEMDMLHALLSTQPHHGHRG